MTGEGATGEGGDPPAPLPRAQVVNEPRDEPPPFWGRWGRIYLLIAGLLLIETALLWALTRWAR
ncbi:MAG: hypothetical protein E6J90_19000 [Deltaproteobacteria bacterium]|nr:MAG: hypothetical protein E6J90_19000 [Deltaproteobacteria bacterium]